MKKKRKKILFIATHRRGRSPSQRFRFEQYLDFFEQNGFDCELSYLISEKDDQILYNKGNYLKKGLMAFNSWQKRKKDVKRANDFDIIFIQREALLTRSSKFEKLFSNSKAKVIYDFDDAIWLPNISDGNRALKSLKNPSKTAKVIAYADMIFAGNSYLAEFAKKHNDNVKIIPTTIDTNYHKRKDIKRSEAICIGWTGTQTTLKYLEPLKEVFEALKNKYGSRVYFKIICDQPWEFEGVDIKNERWNRAKEVEQLSEIDIGIMPLSDSEWSRGKCGFKGLQYMALGCAAVLSPVGVNKEIIEDGVNGFLAGSQSEWIRTLSLLIENKKLRQTIGEEARKKIKRDYAVAEWKNKYIEYFYELLK